MRRPGRTQARHDHWMGAAVALVQIEGLVPLQLAPAALLRDGAARPDAQPKLAVFALELAQRVAVLPLDLVLAPGLQPEQRAALQAAPGTAASVGHRAEVRLVHVAEKMQRKALGRGVDLVGEVPLGVGREPGDGVVGQEQTRIVLPNPIGTVPAAGPMKLLDVQVEPPLEVAFRQLEVGAVEAQDAELEAARVDRSCPIPGQETAVDDRRLWDGGILPPLVESLERIGH
ncbi:MAG: hypothetical protein U9Q81_18220 [Pseudomonadota bacterium]|nr:hypothetical protein [Pseudomonadota bacterium]